MRAATPGTALGAVHVTVRELRTGQVLRRDASVAPDQDVRELDRAAVPRGPARPVPADDREVPGAPGTPAGAPVSPTPATPPARRPARPATPDAAGLRSQARTGNTRHDVERQVAVADDGLLSRLRTGGDTLVVEVRAGRRSGRGTLVVAPDRAGCHVVLVRAPTAIVLR